MSCYCSLCSLGRIQERFGRLGRTLPAPRLGDLSSRNFDSGKIRGRFLEKLKQITQKISNKKGQKEIVLEYTFLHYFLLPFILLQSFNRAQNMVAPVEQFWLFINFFSAYEIFDMRAFRRPFKIFAISRQSFPLS